MVAPILAATLCQQTFGRAEPIAIITFYHPYYIPWRTMPTPTPTPNNTIRYLFSLRQYSPKLLAFMTFTQVSFAILTTTIAPLFVSRLLVTITNGSATLHSSAWLLFGYIIILFLGDVIAIRLSIAMAFLTETKMQKAIARKIMQHLSHKSLGYHSNRMTGGTISNATKLNGAIERFWDTIMFTALPIVTTIVSVCIALGFLFWPYAVILFILSSLVIALIIQAQSAIAPSSRRVTEASSAMTAKLADVVSNIAIVKAFAKEDFEQENYDKQISVWQSAISQEMKKVLLMTGSFSVMMTVLNGAAFFIAIIATEHHLANVGTIYLVIVYTLNVVLQLWSVSNATRNYIRVIGDAGPMITALNEPIEIHDSPDAKNLQTKDAHIKFNAITFTHEESIEPLFKNFTLAIKPGERVGLVGHSGSGKTSLTRILLRFSEIERGTITIDEQNIANVSQTSLHQAIAYVPQDPMLFHRSLRENIAYGKPDASDEEIFEAAHQANALDFIKQLPHGLDTTVGERGVKLSGGQRQRIAIARAILKDAPILVLDEATSALDSESEKLIQSSLEKLMKNRTSIVIAHRLSTIAKLDRIIVLSNGNIAEDGTHHELIAHGGVYAKLWSHQSGGFIEE